jgi:thyroxine 5-deiodinase
MASLERFIELARAHADTVDFAVVYLEEAHPTNGWLYPSVEHYIEQHTALTDRVAAASILEQRLVELTADGNAPRVPIYVDGMDNAVSLAFGALPERLAIVVDGRVEFIGGRGPEE